MRGVTTPGTPPAGDAEWARDTEKRIRQLESPNTMRIGPWVISSRDGDLIATKPGEEIVFGQLPDDENAVSDVTRGYIGGEIDKITESIGNPNGGGGIPKIKDFLNGKWDDLVVVTEVADARSTAGNTLVTNPGFEKDVFYLGDGQLSTTIKRTGSRSAKLTATGAAQKCYLISGASGPATVTATAGDIFYVEAWVWGAAGNTQVSGGANGMSIYLEVYNKDRAVIGQPLTLTGPTASNALTNQWIRFYGYIAIPTSAPYTATAGVSAYIGLNANVTPGDAYYFDDPIIRVDSLVNSWNWLYDAAVGTSGTTGKGPIDIFDPLRNIRNKALEGASGASGALNTAQQAASGASAANGKAQGFLDAFFIGVKNLTGIDFTVGQAESAARGINTSLSNLNIITSNLVAQQQAGMFYGTAVSENLSAYDLGSTLGAKWSLFNLGGGSASWGISDSLFGASINGLYGVRCAGMFPLAGSSGRTSRARLVQTTKTRFQKVGVVFAGTGGNVRSAPTSGTRHATYIYGRMSADGARYVYAKFTGTQVSIGYNTGAGEIDIPSSVRNFTQNAGATYWLECGVSAIAQYTYRLWENNTAVTTGVDSSATSPNSPTDSLGAGFGGWVENDNYTPATVAGFALYDNVPPAQRGIGFKGANIVNNVITGAGASQVASSNFNLSPNSSNSNTGFFPQNWFLPIYATEQLLYDPSINTLTVAQPGWYLVTVAQKGTSDYQWALGGRVAAALFKDTGSGQFLIDQIGPETVHSTNKSSFGAAFVTYLQGGDRIRPGYWATGETTGLSSYVGSAAEATCWTATFLHNSYIPVTTF